MARLTEEQKILLDSLILKYYPEKQWGETLSIKEILDTVSKDDDFINGVSEVNIRFAMSRLIAKNHNCTYEYSRGAYELKSKLLYSISSRGFKIWKDKNILIIPNEIDKDNPLKFNFSTGKIENEDFSQNTIRDCGRYIEELLEFGQKYEWIFNYCDNIDQVIEITESRIIPQEYKEKCPKGLINFLKEKGWSFDVDTYENYIFMNEYGKYYKLALGLKKYNEKDINKEVLQKITKMISNSILEGEDFGLFSYINQIYSLYEEVKLIDNTISLNDNRSVQYNMDMLNDIKDRKKNNLLAKQMQKLNFINNLEIGDYIIKVPQSQAEKVEEGQMQNNCVGYYYDTTILKGENFIYFIREKENPDKSFITCRYNKVCRKTTEYRKKNNSSVTEKYLIDMIKEIDNIINNNEF